jgi:hypothetical protein
MRVIFSRKGFDSAAGKFPSPIIEGEPISLPIPTERRSKTSYRLAGLGKIVEQVSKGRIAADNFFGLFASSDGRDRHHRIFGYLEVEEVRRLGSRPSESDSPEGFLRQHPHTIGEWNENNTLYLGPGAKSRSAHRCLRLTKPDSLVSVWSVPTWLKAAGLTYHSNPIRWPSDKELHVASRGQEFVSNIGTEATPKEWLRTVLDAIKQ